MVYDVGLAGHSGGRRVPTDRVQAVDEPAFAVVALAVEAFQSADEALRMVVPSTRLTRLRRHDDHAAITFSPPAPLRVLGGDQPLCVAEVVIPLAGEWTRNGWTFYYRETGGDWFGLRASKPAPAAIDKLSRLMAAVASGEPSAEEIERPRR